MSDEKSNGRVKALSNLSQWMYQAASREDDDGNRQLLTDAGLELLRMAHMTRAAEIVLEDVRKVAVIVQETSRPSVVATEVRNILQSAEQNLVDCLHD